MDRQAACLAEWARSLSVILPDAYSSALKKHGMQSAEHEVFYRSSDNRAVKRTYAGTFGVTPDRKGDQTAATPLFYLRRLKLFNLVFDSEIRLEGIILGGKTLLIGAKGEQVSIVVSQPWIAARDPGHPHPTAVQIEEFMRAFGFEKLSASYFGWHRLADNITILDARPDNFILSATGVVPIDLVISRSAAGTVLSSGDEPIGPKLILP
jgi:hypothetical protein